MGSMSVSACRYCMFVSYVHPVAVLNAAFCMTCSLVMLVEDARGDHMEEAYYRAGLPFFWQDGHADPLDGWHCSLQKQVMSRLIQVQQH